MAKTAVKKGHALPLLPRHDVYLNILGGDGQRFARAFQEAWRRLPLWARRQLLSHWRTGYEAHGYVLSPVIELASYQFGRRRDLGMMDHFGHRFRFRS
jgi:hypothetical protein